MAGIPKAFCRAYHCRISESGVKLTGKNWTVAHCPNGCEKDMSVRSEDTACCRLQCSTSTLAAAFCVSFGLRKRLAPFNFGAVVAFSRQICRHRAVQVGACTTWLYINKPRRSNAAGGIQCTRARGIPSMHRQNLSQNSYLMIIPVLKWPFELANHDQTCVTKCTGILWR